jgi:hypothetical protein
MICSLFRRLTCNLCNFESFHSPFKTITTHIKATHPTETDTSISLVRFRYLNSETVFLNNKITENYRNCNDGNYSFTNQWNEAEHIICIAYIVSLSPIRIISWLSGARNVPTSFRITVLSGAATFTSAILAAGLPTKEKDRRSSKKVTITKRFNSN